jgi:hypothetical protein
MDGRVNVLGDPLTVPLTATEGVEVVLAAGAMRRASEDEEKERFDSHSRWLLYH